MMNYRTLTHTVHVVPKKEIERQRASFEELLHRLGRVASAEEIAQVLAEREVAEPEPDLAPETLKRIQERIAEQRQKLKSFNS